MPTKSSLIESGMLLLIEWVLFFTIALFWSNWGGTILHMVWTLLVNSVLLTAVVLTLKLKFNQNRMIVYYGLCLGVVLITWLIFSWPVFLSFILTFYFLWRLFSFVEDRTVEIRWWLWIVTICLTLILWLSFQSSTFHKTLIALLVMQTLLVVGFELFQVWRVSKRIGVFFTALLGFIGVTVSGLIISLLFPFIKWVFNLILDLVLLGIGYVVELLWLLLARALYTKASEERLNKMLNNSNKQVQKEVLKVPLGHGMNADLFMILVFILLAGISYFLIRRWRLSDTKENTSRNHATSASTRIVTKTRQSYRILEIFKAPKDPVRAAIFHMQKRLRKTQLGRLKHETLGDWLERLPVQPSNRETVQTVYEWIRYGNGEEVSDLNKSSFKKAMEALEDDLKKNS